jgi:hypothetical protein
MAAFFPLGRERPRHGSDPTGPGPEAVQSHDRAADLRSYQFLPVAFS